MISTDCSKRKKTPFVLLNLLWFWWLKWFHFRSYCKWISKLTRYDEKIYLHKIWFDHCPLIRAIEYNTAMIIGTDIIQSCIITKRVKKSEHMWRFGRGQRRQWWQVATRRTSYKLIDRIVDCEWNWRGKIKMCDNKHEKFLIINLHIFITYNITKFKRGVAKYALTKISFWATLSILL